MEYDLQLIGARLQAARKAKGYTQDYVSARADITEKFLSQIERGKAGLSVQTLIALCDILEITPNYVLLPDAARVLEEPIGPLLKGMSQRQLQDVEEMVRIFVRNCRHEEKGRPRGGRRNMRRAGSPTAKPRRLLPFGCISPAAKPRGRYFRTFARHDCKSAGFSL